MHEVSMVVLFDRMNFPIQCPRFRLRFSCIFHEVSMVVLLTCWLVAGFFPLNSHELSTGTFLERFHYVP